VVAPPRARRAGVATPSQARQAGAGAAALPPLKDQYSEPERGSEWEPIKILLGGDGDSNKTNTTSNTHLRLTTQVGQGHAATEVILDLGTNKQPSEQKHTNTNSGSLHGLLPVLLRSDRWPARSQTGGQRRSGRCLQQLHNKCSRKPQ
jgi:hypothetical protein